MRIRSRSYRTWILAAIACACVSCERASRVGNPAHKVDADVLEHDLGVVHPGTVHTRDFRITNTGTERWTLHRIRTGCSCTATKVSAESVEPGKEMVVTVSYRAPSKNADEHRTLTVDFVEPSAADAKLTLRARVRGPLSLSAHELAFDIPHDRTKPMEQVVSIENYSPLKWKSLRVECDVPWLHAVIQKAPTIKVAHAAQVNLPGSRARVAAVTAPVEAHRLIMSVDASNLAIGNQFAQVTITADAAAKSPHSDRVLVQLTVEPAFRVLPGKLFFGLVRAGESCTKKVRIRFATSAPPIDHAVVSSSLSHEITLSCTALDSRTWNVIATLVATRERSLDGESVVLEVPELESRTIRIPIGGSVASALDGATEHGG